MLHTSSCWLPAYQYHLLHEACGWYIDHPKEECRGRKRSKFHQIIAANMKMTLALRFMPQTSVLSPNHSELVEGGSSLVVTQRSKVAKSDGMHAHLQKIGL